MNFDFSDEQKLFRDQVAKLLATVAPLSECRQALDGKSAFASDVWNALAQMGFQGILIDERFGGLGLGYLELCVAAEEIGRSLAPIPSLSSVYLCSEAIRRYGSEVQKARWLPGLANGTIVGTWAAAEGASETTANNLEARVVAGQLKATKLPVWDASIARICVVLALDATARPQLVLSDLTSPGIALEQLSSIDPSRPLFRLRFDASPVEELLGSSHDGYGVYGDLLNRAAIVLAFEQVGAADRALFMARDYALERHAFGRPIGANQAIKHKLANVYVKNALARAHAYYGAWALSTDAPELGLAAAGARVAASDAFGFAAQENIQTHGGIGFTWESDCQLFYRRARLYATAIGAVHNWKEQIVRTLESTNAL